MFSSGAKKRLGSDATPRQRLRRSNPGQEILELQRGTLPGPAWSLGAGQHPISLGFSQEQAGLFLEGNPSLARVPGGLSCISGSSLMVNDEKIRGALGRVVFRSLHMPRDFSP